MRIRSALFALTSIPTLLLAAACLERGHAEPLQTPLTNQDQYSSSPGSSGTAARRSVGVTDRGIFSDLDAETQLTLPAAAKPGSTRAVVDAERGLLVLYLDGWPRKVYPVAKAAGDGLTEHLDSPIGRLMLRPGDRAELAPLLGTGNMEELAKGAAPSPGDADKDGIPDPLDILIGGKKTVLNGASYGAGYIEMDYPMGDVPRNVGVCTDVIIRSVRNAGLDLQPALQRDIRRSRRSYPMVNGNGNKHIDHRRVRTLLPYFKRRWKRHSKAIDDARDPLRPGDVVLMDTLPQSGPDHIGIVSDQIGESGHPLIINNWTWGTVTAEMDLLGMIPVTHRFRFPSR